MNELFPHKEESIAFPTDYNSILEHIHQINPVEWNNPSQEHILIKFPYLFKNEEYIQTNFHCGWYSSPQLRFRWRVAWSTA